MAQLTTNAILIVAHPDDEALWFSSVLQDVDHVVFCFIDYERLPSLGPARVKVLSEYPLKNITSLDLSEAGTYESVNWRYPRETQYGLEIATDSIVRNIYQHNFATLCDRLRPLVKSYQNVITHNPWGEYGHPDHVQIYRAVKTLKMEFHYKTWFSNYCSNLSIGLALDYMSGFNHEYVSLPTNIELATRLCRLYRNHDCWTWYNDYKWFNEEAYMEDNNPADGEKDCGRLYPLNMLKIPSPVT